MPPRNPLKKRVIAVPIVRVAAVRFISRPPWYIIIYQKVYHSDTLLYQRQQKLVRISEPIHSFVVIWDNSAESDTQQPILKAN